MTHLYVSVAPVQGAEWVDSRLGLDVLAGAADKCGEDCDVFMIIYI
jgi:hypothetical protein